MMIRFLIQQYHSYPRLIGNFNIQSNSPNRLLTDEWEAVRQTQTLVQTLASDPFHIIDPDIDTLSSWPNSNSLPFPARMLQLPVLRLSMDSGRTKNSHPLSCLANCPGALIINCKFLIDIIKSREGSYAAAATGRGNPFH